MKTKKQEIEITTEIANLYGDKYQLITNDKNLEKLFKEKNIEKVGYLKRPKVSKITKKKLMDDYESFNLYYLDINNIKEIPNEFSLVDKTIKQKRTRRKKNG
jgi:hypothetical protein